MSLEDQPSGTSAMTVSSSDLEALPTPFSLSCSQGISCAIDLNVTSQGIMYFSEFPNKSQLLMEWKGGPRRILLLAKQDPDIMPKVIDAVSYLHSKGLEVLVEENVFPQVAAGLNSNLNGKLGAFQPSKGRCGVDLIITFGGDGLLMYCNTLFDDSQAVPPIMSFDFGSLGFLAPFLYREFREQVDLAMKQPVCITLRTRLECQILRGTVCESTHHVLNEVVIDRGMAPFLSVVDVSCNKEYLTTIQGDGVIVATPTGSTAYSLAAGGSMVHPNVPAILLTPVCAHTLSIRPMLLPETSELQCSVPFDSRASGWVSFDGRFRQELKRGDSIVVRKSLAPLPTVTKMNFTGDWMGSLQENFYFNKRKRQGRSQEGEEHMM